MASKNTDIIEQLADTIVANLTTPVAKRGKETAPNDKSFYATILGVNQKFVDTISTDDQATLIEKFSLPETIEDGENSYYIFKINGAYYCKSQNGDFKLYDPIIVYIPNGDWSRMYFDYDYGSSSYNRSGNNGSGTMRKIIPSVEAPGGVEPSVGDFWLQINDDSITDFNEIPKDAVTSVYVYIEDEDTEVQSWVNVKCPLTKLSPSNSKVGDYYIKIDDNDYLEKILVCAEKRESLTIWKEVYPESETGTDYNLHIYTDKPMDVGDIWIRIDSDETQNIISCNMWSFNSDTKKYYWELLYNALGGGSKIHVSVDEPKPLAEGDFLVMMPDTTTVSELYRYENGQWSAVNFLYGTTPPAPIVDTYYCIVAAGALRQILDGNNSWATVAPTPNSMYVNEAANTIVNPNDYWIKITDDTNKIATICYQYTNDEWVERYKFGATLGNGLEYDANGNIQAKLGEGLTFDENGAIKMAYNPVVNIAHALVYKKESQV